MIETTREYHFVLSEQRKLRKEGYAAITYTDHMSDGSTREGTEDFSLIRWKQQVTGREIYVPTGKLDKGGHRRWERFGSVFARSVKDCGKIAKKVMAGREYAVRKY